MTAIEMMEELYRSEINFELCCFYDGGWFWRLGDHFNGWKTADDHVPTLTEAVEGIWKAAKRFYPKADCFGKEHKS